MDKKWFVRQMSKEDISQRKLARMLGMCSSNLSYIFSQRIKMSIDTAERISEILNVPFEKVIEKAGVKVPSRYRLKTDEEIEYEKLLGFPYMN